VGVRTAASVCQRLSICCEACPALAQLPYMSCSLRVLPATYQQQHCCTDTEVIPPLLSAAAPAAAPSKTWLCCFNVMQLVPPTECCDFPAHLQQLLVRHGGHKLLQLQVICSTMLQQPAAAASAPKATLALVSLVNIFSTGPRPCCGAAAWSREPLHS
jgi:hypothetical protein